MEEEKEKGRKKKKDENVCGVATPATRQAMTTRPHKHNVVPMPSSSIGPTQLQKGKASGGAKGSVLAERQAQRASAMMGHWQVASTRMGQAYMLEMAMVK
jgi:hypothetical protein